MGRLTQMVEYINATPEELQKLKQTGVYTHLEIGEREKEVRKSYQAELKKLRKENAIKAGTD
jgi:hypothetical protein